MKAQTDTLGFLLAEVSRLMRRAFRERMDREPQSPSLTHAQSRALLNVWRHEGIRQVALAERLDVHPMTLARLIDQLASLGMVERRPDPDDRRAWRLYVTERALPRMQAVRRIGAAVRVDALRGIDAQQAQQLHELLRRMHDNLASEACRAGAPTRGNG